MRLTHRGGVALALGITQTVAWASSYYLPAMLAAPMARDLNLATPTVFAAFSVAMLAAAVLGPYAGRAIDRWGGRPVLIATNLIFAAGLLMLAFAQNVWALFAGWVLLGVGMGSGLYEAAFATLVGLYGSKARNAITGVTLLGGFASTVGWPLSGWIEAEWGWRTACFAWTGIHLLLALPLNLLLPSRPQGASTRVHEDAGAEHDKPAVQESEPKIVPDPRYAARNTALLAYVFAVTWFISTSMASHLPRLLMAAGATLAAAIAAGALLGPAQVGARLLEFGLLRKIHPLLSARLAAFAHPLAATILLLLSMPYSAAFVPIFVILHGAGNGIMTIAKGTLPLALFGAQGYGARLGILMAPSRIAQAVAPWLFGLCLDLWDLNALWLCAALGVTAFIALMALRHGGSTQQKQQ